MRWLLPILLSILMLQSEAQENRLSISLNYRPEINFYKDGGIRRFSEITPMATFNPSGLRTMIGYKISNHLEIKGGIGFVNRRFFNKPFFNWSLVSNDSTPIGLSSKKTCYRIIEFPVNLGYAFYLKEKITIKPIAGVSANYLVNAYYKPGKYAGTYNKNYWLGYSIVTGLQLEYKFRQNLSFTTMAEYSVKNKVKKDILLSSVYENAIALNHHFLTWLLGVKYDFR